MAQKGAYALDMSSRVLRVLVLVSSLPLVFPPDCCCFFASVSAAAAPKKAPVQPATSCPHCSQPAKAEPASPDKPVSPEKKQCPLCDWHPTVVAVKSVDPVKIALGLSALLALTTVLPNDAVAPGPIAFVVHPPPGQIHVLHCVWLC
jgi:hypothetical protein